MLEVEDWNQVSACPSVPSWPTLSHALALCQVPCPCPTLTDLALTGLTLTGAVLCGPCSLEFSG